MSRSTDGTMGLQEAVESQRLQQFFKYFAPTTHAARLFREDIDSLDVYRTGTPDLSTDPVLNGLAQLAACRLDCERSFISLIDDANQFIIAEMTRSISLFDNTSHAADDGLCIGVRALARNKGICGRTISSFIQDSFDALPPSNPNISVDDGRYVITNLASEPQYAERPYVAGYPYMRFYAGVPLRSESGLVIGILAVIDNKPRAGVSEEQFRCLTDLSSTVMTHLNSVRLQESHARSVALLDGLNALIQHRETDQSSERALSITDIDHGHRKKYRSHGASSAVSDIQNTDECALSPTSTDLQDSAITETTTNTSHGDEDSSAVHLQTLTTPMTFPPDLDTTFADSGPPKVHLNPDGEYQVVGKADVEKQKVQDQEIFQYSARILQKAMDLDGVLFINTQGCSLEHSTNQSGLVVDPNDHMAGADLPTRNGSTNTTADTASRVDSPVSTSRSRDLYCTQLGCSVRSGVAWKGRRSTLSPISHSLYKKVATAFPVGCVFNFHSRQRFHNHGTFEPQLYRDRRKNQGHMPLVDDTKQAMMDLENDLFAQFSDVYSLVYLPLKSTHSDKWQVGCFGWSVQPRRYLQQDDLAYFTVFGNSILAEVIRIELADLSKAKSDFISSISHELRSPLHGILGSAELLKEIDLDDEYDQLVFMVENCANALLENLENVLHYSKINHKPQHVTTASSDVVPLAERAGDSTMLDDTMFDLALLVEQGVDSLVLGHQQRESRTKSFASYGSNDLPSLETSSEHVQTPRPVLIALQIEDQNSWMIQSKKNLWQRVLMNVLGNAQKYTKKGHILVSLKLVSDPEHSEGVLPRTRAVLTIRDTGKGISSTFLQKHLFQPFFQEHILSPGTGLGLSIVKAMIENEGGSISIASEIGRGTEVTISIPITLQSVPSEIARQPAGENLTMTMIEPRSMNDEGGHGPVSSTEYEAIRSAVELGAQSNNLAILSTEWAATQAPADVFVIDDTSLDSWISSSGCVSQSIPFPATRALVVLCTKHMIKDRYKHVRADGVYHLLPPYGPRQIGNIIDRIRRSSVQPSLSLDMFASGISGSKAGKPPPKNTRTARAVASSPNSSTTISNHRTNGTLDATTVLEDKRDVNQRPSTDSPKVLLVDDNALNLQLLCRCVDKLQVQYTTACNGLEALKAVTEAGEAFDRILMDISMPVMNGFEATRAIRAFEAQNQRKKAVITAMTGLGSESAQVEAFSSGFDDFLIKPVELKKIRALLQINGTMSMNPG